MTEQWKTGNAIGKPRKKTFQPGEPAYAVGSNQKIGSKFWNKPDVDTSRTEHKKILFLQNDCRTRFFYGNHPKKCVPMTVRVHPKWKITTLQRIPEKEVANTDGRIKNLLE